MKQYFILLLFVSISLSLKSSKRFKDLKQFEATGKRLDTLHNIVFKEHMDAISEACKKSGSNYIISIRETGANSINRIAEGAKAKPHTILEKSIKEKVLKELYKNQNWETESSTYYKKLNGFVGHYEYKDNKPIKLLGVRTDGLSGVNNIEDCGKGCSFLSIDNAIEELDKDPKFSQNFYTGDYDLHEAYNNHGEILLEGTQDKVNMLNALNKAIAKIDIKRTGEMELSSQHIVFKSTPEHAWAMFQHGDQATYKMNQHIEAKSNGSKVAEIVKSVNEEDKGPLGWNVRGVWYVTLSLEENREFRDLLKVKAPSHWQNGMKESGKTYVVKRRMNQLK